MTKRTPALMAAIVVCLTMISVMPAQAQPATAPTWQDDVSQHHRMIYQMIRDMTEQMSEMTEQMSRGELTSEQRKQMVERMGLMSTIMRRMSGLAARPAIKHGELQKQVDEMRKQMVDMKRMAPGAR